MVLAVSGDRLALPSSTVRGLSRLSPDMVVHQDGRHLVRLGRRVVAPYFLGDILDGREPRNGVLIEGVAGGRQVCVVADEVLGEEEVLLTRLPVRAGAPPVLEAMTLLASGRPVAVLSLHRLVQRDAPRQVAPDSRVAQRPVRVLLVDDSRVTREMVRRLLEDGGFEVVPVAEADQALRLLGEQEFDCLVTDIEMPGMGGLELTRRLRETPSLAHLPVIVVSTRDRSEDRLAGLEAGADAYLAKQSLDARELVALVERVGGRG
jgi:CheY-like chemotaxis protein